MVDQTLSARLSALGTSAVSTSMPDGSLNQNTLHVTAVNNGKCDAGTSSSSQTQLTPASCSLTASTASSKTREQLRQTVLERDELCQAMSRERANTLEMRSLAEKNKAIVERLKREGNKIADGLSATDAKYRMFELERDVRAARAEKQAPSQGMFKAACSTDLLFLIDTTSSMKRHIDAAKKQVLDIVNDIKEAFLDDADVRIGVVSYKDHDDVDNIDHIDFTSSANDVKSFIGKLTASGGGDIPEDVLGGIQEALSMSWKQQTRCLIHIADAPAHGRPLNTCITDNYAIPGDEPHSLTYKPLLQQMIRMNINYTFLRIAKITDLMTSAFLKQYIDAGADGFLHLSNTYYDISKDRIDTPSVDSSMTAKAGLQFAELELGTSYSDIRRLVVSSVTSSASRTAVRMSSLRSSKAWNNNGPKTQLATLSEEEVQEDPVLDTAIPAWNRGDWLDEKLVVDGFSPSVIVHGAATLNDKMASDQYITMSVSELTILKHSRPFAQGAMRIAFYARTVASEDLFVVKSFKRSGKRLAHLVEDMRCQALCKAFALEFNALSNEDQAIDFISTTCFKGKGMRRDASADNCLSLEPYIQGKYVKYNTNSGWINEKKSDDRFFQIAQAFSHFTFERSKGHFLVCDLQGVGCILTDPAIHTLDPERFKLMDTNLGEDGFKFFFSTHTCNDICFTLRLQSQAYMFRPGGIFTFRTDWPLLNRTTCCSNKLCGKIIHICLARQSDEYPGYDWCKTCYPQLRQYTQRWLCVAGDADHEFDVSTFFYESQGRRWPRKCPSHRGDSEMAVDRSKVYRDLGSTVVTEYPYSPASVTATEEPFAGNETKPAVKIPAPYIAPSTYVSQPPSYSFEPPTSTSVPPAASGAMAMPRNSNGLWAKLKSATKFIKC